MECSVEGCSRKKHAKGFCGMHYMRTKNGVPMDAPLQVMRGRGCQVEDCKRPHKGHGYCEKHLDRVNRHGAPVVVRSVVPDDSPEGTRTCTECNQTKPDSEFYQHPTRLYFERKCRECRARLARVAHVLRKFGPEAAQIEERHQAGEGCEICGLFKPGLMALDHDHETGKPCGLLCRTCNSAIGQLGDSVLLVEAALEYLRRTRV